MMYLAGFVLIGLSYCNGLPVQVESVGPHDLSSSDICQAPAHLNGNPGDEDSVKDHAVEKRLADRTNAASIETSLQESGQTRKSRRHGRKTGKRSIQRQPSGRSLAIRSTIERRKKRRTACENCEAKYNKEESAETELKRKRREEGTIKRNENPKLKELMGLGHENKVKYHQPKDDGVSKEKRDRESKQGKRNAKEAEQIGKVSGNNEAQMLQDRDKREKGSRDLGFRKEDGVKKKDEKESNLESNFASEPRTKREPEMAQTENFKLDDSKEQDYYGDYDYEDESQNAEERALYSSTDDLAEKSRENRRKRRDQSVKETFPEKENSLLKVANSQNIARIAEAKETSKRQNPLGDEKMQIKPKSSEELTEEKNSDLQESSNVEKRSDSPNANTLVAANTAEAQVNVAVGDAESREKRAEQAVSQGQQNSEYDNRQYDGEDYYYNESDNNNLLGAAELEDDNADIKGDESKFTEQKRSAEFEKKTKNAGGDEDYGDSGVMEEGGKDSSTTAGIKLWDDWSCWSPCSVSCGGGKSVTWRHCIGGTCEPGDKEARIKQCNTQNC